MASEPAKESSGGLSFEIILKPANEDLIPDLVIQHQTTPAKPLAHGDIEKKLKEAEERRQAAEAQRLAFVLKNNERNEEVNKRLNALQETFAKETEKRLIDKLETTQENKDARIRELQERLREHAKKVEDLKNVGDCCNEDLRERIEKKLEIAGEKRFSQLNKIRERIKKHEKHIDEVIHTTYTFGKETEEKLIKKMNTSLKNRDEHLKVILNRLKEHNNKIKSNRLSPTASGSDSSLDDLSDDQSEDTLNRTADKTSGKLPKVEISSGEDLQGAQKLETGEVEIPGVHKSLNGSSEKGTDVQTKEIADKLDCSKENEEKVQNRGKESVDEARSCLVQEENAQK